MLSGCIVEVPAQKQFDCGLYDGDNWHCLSRTTDKCIKNTYVELEECEGIK